MNIKNLTFRNTLNRIMSHEGKADFPQFYFVDPSSVAPVKWDDLIGLEKQVKKIKGLLSNHLLHPLIRKPTGILLWGVPGKPFAVIWI